MSSRESNVIYEQDLINLLLEEFKDINLVYNILAGYILKYNPNSNKKISLDSIQDYKTNSGLYVSYTTARLFSLFVKYKKEHKYIVEDVETYFMYLKSKANLNPSILYKYLVDYCNTINTTYENIKFLDDINLYNTYLTNITFMLKKLGLYTISKI